MLVSGRVRYHQNTAIQQLFFSVKSWASQLDLLIFRTEAYSRCFLNIREKSETSRDPPGWRKHQLLPPTHPRWASQPPLLGDHRSSNNSHHFDLYPSHIRKVPATEARRQDVKSVVKWIKHTKRTCLWPSFVSKLECHWVCRSDIKASCQVVLQVV